MAVRSANGGRPASISYAIAAERIDVGAVIDVGIAAACSGAMYAGVPIDDADLTSALPGPRACARR